MWADCVREREGNSVIEEDFGFIEYKVVLPFMRIELMWIKPEFRLSGKGRELCDRVTQLGREAGATTLWSEVQVHTFNATESLAAALAYGFQVRVANAGSIILTKDIGGADGEKGR